MAAGAVTGTDTTTRRDRLGAGDDTGVGPRLVALATVAGVSLGGVDLLAQRVLPYPWANLANSSAVWAVWAFLFTFALGGRGRRAVTSGELARDLVGSAVLGAVLLIVAVESYYVAAVVFLGSDLWTLYRPASVLWLLFGVLAGVVFGPAGRLARSSRPWSAAAGVAAVVAVLWGEASLLLLEPSVPGYETRGEDGTALVTAVLGAILLVAVARRPVAIARACLLAVPFAALSLAAFRFAGFGY